MDTGNNDPNRSPMAFGHYGDFDEVARRWSAAVLTSSAVYVVLGIILVVIGTATRDFFVPRTEPVSVTFVEKVARLEPPTEVPAQMEKPKLLPPAPELKSKPRRRAPAAVVPRNMKVRKLEAPLPPKEIIAPQEMPKELPREADPREDKGVAILGDPGIGDAAGLEGGGGNAAGNNVGGFELPDGAVAPQPYKSNVRPQYPASAMRKQRTGIVTIRCVVRANGRLDEIEVLSGEEPFVTESLRAVRRWRYEPALLEGQPISVPHVIELRFQLKT